MPPLFINGRFLGRPVSGVERFGRELLTALDRLSAAGEAPPLVVLAPKGTNADLSLEAGCYREVGAHRGHVWEQLELARAARGLQLVGFANSGPVAHPRQLVVIHDAAPYRFPEAYGWRYRLWHRSLGRVLARRARLATVSRFSQGELAHFLRVPAEQIAVVPNGSDHLVRRPLDPEVIARLGLTEKPYLLAVGSANRNKNLAAVLAAWARLPAGEARLVVAGAINDRVFATVRNGLGAGVIFTGRIDDAALAALYAGAAAFVFPSHYEGFGIPPLEAMAHGTPVLAADIPAVREVCADAVDYFASDDVERLAALMMDALERRGRDPARAARAAARLGTFRWDLSARALLAAVTSC